MYVKHPDPPPLGTRLVFELVLGEERKPVQGAGVVAWTREKYEGPGRPAGIGIQFTEVDSLSRQHIAEALFAYLETQLGDELAESQDVVRLGEEKRRRKKLAMLVANRAQDAMGADDNEVTILDDRGAHALPRMDKLALARRLVVEIAARLPKR